MEWPSKNVAPGGLFHTAKATYSPQTHQFLNVLMEESKLSMMQRQKVNYFLRTGDPLPSVSSAPTGRKNGKFSRPPPFEYKPGSPKRRSLETILKSGVYEREKFISNSPLVDREKEKLKLQNIMAFREDAEPKAPKSGGKGARKSTKIKELNNTNRFDQIVKEIKDREDWLKEMEGLGAGDKYKNIIQQQIQARIREMKRLKAESYEKFYE